jgi:hypothetical protein
LDEFIFFQPFHRLQARQSFFNPGQFFEAMVRNINKQIIIQNRFIFAFREESSARIQIKFFQNPIQPGGRGALFKFNQQFSISSKRDAR